MTMSRKAGVQSNWLAAGVMLLVGSLLLPTSALAQSGIAGVVRDESGGVLPGVTVEATSSALIEKVRMATSDDQGQYRILELRPGPYTVTFTLTGFKTVIREGIELSSNFTATVNAQLPLGSLEESLIVTAQAPVVDVQNTSARHVVPTDVIDSLPTAKAFQNLAVLVPGMGVTGGTRLSPQDVGGLGGDRNFMVIHGGRDSDMTYQIDGLTYNTMQTAGASSGLTPNPGEVQEYAYEIGNLNAETGKGGVRVNLIPKDGGNTVKGSFFANGMNEQFVSDNVSDELRARGLRAGNSPQKVYDVTASLGGPIIRDALWYHGSYRNWAFNDYVANMWYDSDPLDFTYTPDFSRPAVEKSLNWSAAIRLTWQASLKNKFAGHYVRQGRCGCPRNIGNTRTPEASEYQHNPTLGVGTVTWSAPITNRLLLEAGWLRNEHRFGRKPAPEVDAATTFGVIERSTGLNFRAGGTAHNWTNNLIDSYKLVLSYVTGTHAFKVGTQWRKGWRTAPSFVPGPVPMTLRLLNGVPDSVVVYTTPYTNRERLNADGGIFVQDQWTLRRVTLYGGIRYDHLNAQVDPISEPAAFWVGPRDFPKVSNVPNWNDVSPRMGGSFDLFGDGRTAVKASHNRYVAGQSVDLARQVSQLNTSVNSTTRTWTDRNGDFYPDLDELGPLANANFGRVNVTTRFDEAVLNGFGRRGFNWETSAGVQHELIRQVAVQAMYFRRSYGNFTVTDNRAVTEADYSPYSITVPVDSRLPNGGGYQVTGLYDIDPSKFGQSDNYVSFAKNYGEQSEVYNGFDFSMNARLPRGAYVQGGTSTGRIATSRCFVVDSPQELYNCKVTPPFRTEVKVAGSITLPWAFQVSGTYQSIPGPEIAADYLIRNAQVQGLGRNLSGGNNASATVAIVPPGTMFERRLNQVDLRLARVLPVGRTRIKAALDVYNAFNGSAVLVLNNTYGPSWQEPAYILPPRMFKLGVQVDF